MDKLKYQKYQNQLIIKDKIRQDTWCSSHINCFRLSVTAKNTHFSNIIPESDKHIKTKLERYLYWRRAGCNILVEPRLKNGMRPDLLIWNEYEIWIEEILESETDNQFKNKVKKYPFKTAAYRMGE